ncbi:MAG: plasmid stabilization protein [Pseudomonadota bacterium]
MIRNLDDDVKEKLRVRAAAHGHSMEAEARAVLEASVAEDAEQKRSLGDIFDEHFGVDVRADLTEHLPKRDDEQPMSPFE